MPDPCEIAVQAAGFNRFVRRDAALTVGARLNIEIQLEPGKAAAPVTLAAEEPIREAASAPVRHTFDNQSVMRLPVLGNNVMPMAGLAEGMQRTSGYNRLGLPSNSGTPTCSTAGSVRGDKWAPDTGAGSSTYRPPTGVPSSWLKPPAFTPTPAAAPAPT